MSKNAPFRVGESVICVDDQNFVSPDPGGHTACVKGERYTIRDCFLTPYGWWGVYLNEIVNPPYYWSRGFVEGCFKASRFAPYNPYSNSVSKELAEKAMSVGDGADQPIKIKELQTAIN